jgi:hypothetical protein
VVFGCSEYNATKTSQFCDIHIAIFVTLV